MAATHTDKTSLTLAISSVAMPAFVARLGRIASVNRFNPDAVLARNVFDFGEERRKRPSVVDQSLLPGDFDSRSNAFQIFNHYRPGIGFQGFVNDLVRHIPEQPIHRSLLFARQPFQEPSLVSALVPCGLKITALLESAFSNVFDSSALENLASAEGGNADDAGIDANRPFALRVGNILYEDQVQVPRPASMGKSSRWFNLPRPIQVLPVVAGENQIDSDSAAQRGQRGVFLIDLDSQRPSVVTHRRRLFPSMADLIVSFVRFRNYAASGANEIRRKLRQLSRFSIGDVVESDGVKDFLPKGDVRGVVERNYIGFLSLRKRLTGFCSRFKFYLQSNSRLNVGNIYHVTYSITREDCAVAKPPRNADFLCQLKQAVSLGGIL